MDSWQEETQEDSITESAIRETQAPNTEEPPIHSSNSAKSTFIHFLLRLRERSQVYRINFRIWRLQRPFWGSILILLAGVLVLWGPAGLMRFALFPGSSIWAGLLVGALLLVMGFIQLFAPAYALITGAIAIVLALISMLVALGGFIIGMFLGIIGGALSVAWRPHARSLASIGKRKRTWPRIYLHKTSKVSK